jgi:hypothetical protein
MRIVGLFLFVALLTVLGWHALSIDPVEARAREAAEHRKIASFLGILGALQDQKRFEFRNVVIGLWDPEARTDFRAQLLVEGRYVPVFGQMSTQCKKQVEAPSCWDLVHLEANGRIVNLTAQKVMVAQHVTPVTGPGPVGSTEVVASSEANVVAAVDPDTTQRAVSGDANPPPTHRVARARINARSGPGTGNPIVTRLVEGNRLSLLKTRDGWGHFVVLDGSETGSEVWAALRILDPI